jgi:hypothetical protein
MNINYKAYQEHNSDKIFQKAVIFYLHFISRGSNIHSLQLMILEKQVETEAGLVLDAVPEFGNR